MRRFGVELPCHIDAGPRRQSSRHSDKSKLGRHLGRDLAEQQTNQSGLRLYFAGDIFWSYFLLWRAQREDHM
jgi:hypothetical protein